MTYVAHPAAALYVPRIATWLAVIALYFVVVLIAARASTGTARPGVQPSPGPNRTPNACQVAHRACP